MIYRFATGSFPTSMKLIPKALCVTTQSLFSINVLTTNGRCSLVQFMMVTKTPKGTTNLVHYDHLFFNHTYDKAIQNLGGYFATPSILL